jgi:hypothetical protein
MLGEFKIINDGFLSDAIIDTELGPGRSAQVKMVRYLATEL